MSFFSLTLTLCSLLACGATPCFGDEVVVAEDRPAKALQAFGEGQALEKSRSYQEALAKFHTAQNGDPSLASPLAEIGNCHYYLGERRWAIYYYKMYLKQRPGDEAARKFYDWLRTGGYIKRQKQARRVHDFSAFAEYGMLKMRPQSLSSFNDFQDVRCGFRFNQFRWFGDFCWSQGPLYISGNRAWGVADDTSSLYFGPTSVLQHPMGYFAMISIGFGYQPFKLPFVGGPEISLTSGVGQEWDDGQGYQPNPPAPKKYYEGENFYSGLTATLSWPIQVLSIRGFSVAATPRIGVIALNNFFSSSSQVYKGWGGNISAAFTWH